jgi:catechol 2,3-dioxygenase-like lactoylglutathione lyase family enzyme
MGALHHAAIFVSDIERSSAFYAELLGLTENGRVELEALGIEQVFMSAGKRHGDLVLARRLDREQPPGQKRELFHLAFELRPEEGFAEFVERVGAAEIPIAAGPMEHQVHFDGSGTRDAIYLLDPDGYVVEVTQDRPAVQMT